MTSKDLETLLAQGFMARYPIEAADLIERMPTSEAASVFEQIEPVTCTRVFRTLPATSMLEILAEVDLDTGKNLLLALDPPLAGVLIGELPEPRRNDFLGRMHSTEARRLRALSAYPPMTAGRLRSFRIATFRSSSTVREALDSLSRKYSDWNVRDLIVVDEFGQLFGMLPLHEAAMAESEARLASLVHEPAISVSPFASLPEIVETMQRTGFDSLAVVGAEGVPIGVIRLVDLLHEIKKEFSADLVQMTGARKDESALSDPRVSVGTRLPVLIVSFAMAFLAANLAGLFENTIEKFTALALLFPAICRQSGNTGNQALAVILRGLAVQELTSHFETRVIKKEFVVGLINGTVIGAITCVGVYLWHGSVGLALLTGIAMVVSMTTAGILGVLIPSLIIRLRRDPSQSSLIFVAAATDVVVVPEDRGGSGGDGRAAVGRVRGGARGAPEGGHSGRGRYGRSVAWQAGGTILPRLLQTVRLFATLCLLWRAPVVCAAALVGSWSGPRRGG